MSNILLLTDSYKITHWRQYPPEMRFMYSYLESRGGVYDKTVFFGLQYFLKKYLAGNVLSQEKIDEAASYYDQHLGIGMFNKSGFERMLKKHGGKLPVVIKAVPEGSVVDTGNVLLTVENTDPEFFYLTNFLETLLVQVWYPITVATQSFFIKDTIKAFAELTGDPDLISFKLHDFGYRGVSSVESAGIGGCAHLVNFMGTDTVATLQVAREYYGSQMAAYSIPASEHSTITAWGKEGDGEAMENMLGQFPEGLVACVSDSFDIYKACSDIWGGRLKNKVMSRNGTLVIRPDSGDPSEVVLKVLSILGEKFGYSKNSKGFKVLDKHVRVIQGDGVNQASIALILRKMLARGWSTDNIAFGMGGVLLQNMTRDTQSFVFKCSMVNIGGIDREVYKKPITDPNKCSKRGRLALVKSGDGYITKRSAHGVKDELIVVFENGDMKVEYNLEEIRKTTASKLGSL